MNGNEHRGVGDTASGGARVNVGGGSRREQFRLSFGDVMALSGDYFGAGSASGSSRRDGHARAGEDLATLFSLARVPGEQPAKPGSRDEIICALMVMTVDEDLCRPALRAGRGVRGAVHARARWALAGRGATGARSLPDPRGDERRPFSPFREGSPTTLLGDRSSSGQRRSPIGACMRWRWRLRRAAVACHAGGEGRSTLRECRVPLPQLN